MTMAKETVMRLRTRISGVCVLGEGFMALINPQEMNSFRGGRCVINRNVGCPAFIAEEC